MPIFFWHDKSDEFWTPEVQSMDANVQLDIFKTDKITSHVAD